MEFKKIVIGIAAVALLSVMVANAYACAGPGLSPGFWKHNVGVYLKLANGSYSDPVNSPYVSKDTMGAWLHAGWTDAQLLVLYNELSTKGGGAAGDATRVAAANVFNAAADLYPYV
jgi:hypothetical protein